MNQSNQIRKTALYCRLSQDGGIEGDSNSIHGCFYRMNSGLSAIPKTAETDG